MFKPFITRILIAASILFLAAFSAEANEPGYVRLASLSEVKIVIKQKERKLYYYDANNQVREFKIAVGRLGMNWTGTTTVARKVLNPKWAPPEIIRKEKPYLPAVIEPGPNNPLGAAVLVLGDGTYGIHGTNRDNSIGTAASYGCFRMFNKDILSIFDEVAIGTPVAVMP